VAERESLTGRRQEADSLDVERLRRELLRHVAEIRGLLGKDIPRTRQILRRLLVGRPECEAFDEGQRVGYRFKARGSYAALLPVALATPEMVTPAGFARRWTWADLLWPGRRRRSGSATASRRRARIPTALRERTATTDAQGAGLRTGSRRNLAPTSAPIAPSAATSSSSRYFILSLRVVMADLRLLQDIHCRWHCVRCYSSRPGRWC
jgi:hypothetical protein